MGAEAGPGTEREAGRADVVIVGAGPVGLVAAILLGQRGWRVEVLERHREPFGRPRAVHLDHEAARILQRAGVMDALAPHTEAMDAYEWRNAAGRVLLRIEPPALGPSGWPSSAMFCQAELESLLEERVATLPTVRLRRGVEVGPVEADDAGVVVRGVTGAGPAGDRAVHVAARFVVGCDGAASTTATAIGAAPRTLGAGSTWVVVDVQPAVPRPWSPLNLQICDPNRPTTAVSGGPGRRRFELMVLPGEDPAELGRPERLWPLLAPFGLSPEVAVLERVATYSFGAELTDRWRRGSVLVAGDAAHRMPPFAGQGLCSGLRDAANLAWKLDAVLAGRASEVLLDTYATERARQVETEIAFSMQLGAMVGVLDPDEAARRDEALAAMAASAGPVPPPPNPPLGPGVWAEGRPGAGQLGVQGLVDAGGRRARLDDLVAPPGSSGWVLLRIDDPPLDGGGDGRLGGPGDSGSEGPGDSRSGRVEADPEGLALRGACARLGVALVEVSFPGPAGGSLDASGVLDSDGVYRDQARRLGASALLQRPDGYLFGGTREGESALVLLRELEAMLASTEP